MLLLWPPCVADADIIFLSCFLVFFPRLSQRSQIKCIPYFYTWCAVPLVWIQNAGLKCAARGSMEIQDAKMTQKSPSAHHRATLSGYIFATKACIDNRKKFLNSNISSRCAHNMANFGQLTAEICWRISGTPANFNGFRVLVSLLQRRRSPQAILRPYV